MLMKWTASVITFKPSAREKVETAKQRLEQKDAVHKWKCKHKWMCACRRALVRVVFLQTHCYYAEHNGWLQGEVRGHWIQAAEKRNGKRRESAAELIQSDNVCMQNCPNDPLLTLLF